MSHLWIKTFITLLKAISALVVCLHILGCLEKLFDFQCLIVIHYPFHISCQQCWRFKTAKIIRKISTYIIKRLHVVFWPVSIVTSYHFNPQMCLDKARQFLLESKWTSAFLVYFFEYFLQKHSLLLTPIYVSYN